MWAWTNGGAQVGSQWGHGCADWCKAGLFGGAQTYQKHPCRPALTVMHSTFFPLTIPPGIPSNKPTNTPRFFPRRQKSDGEGLTQIHRSAPSLHQSHLGDFEIFLDICPK